MTPRSMGFWSAVEALTNQAAVMAEWRRQLGSEYNAARRFLRPTSRPARSHPCTHRFPCGCEHRIIDDDPHNLIAVCQCHDSDCPPIPLATSDRLVAALDTHKLGHVISTALRIEPTTPDQFAAAPRSHRLGTCGAAQVPAILSLPTEETDFLAEVVALCAAVPDPFILITPTDRPHTPAVDSALRRQGCLHLPLARIVSLDTTGQIVARHAVHETLSAFDSSLAHRIVEDARRADAGRKVPPAPARQPQYVLRKGRGVWSVTFAGPQAPLKHEKGLLYVAWLLTHPPSEPIHAMDLVAHVPAIYRQQLGITSAVDQKTGKAVAFDATARPRERSHSLDDLEASRRLYRKQQELEAVLEDDTATEPVRAEALAELEQVYEFQKKHALRSKSNADSVVRAVRLAINRFHQRIAAATDNSGQPHPVLRPFAEHLARHLITPSARYNGRMGARTRAGMAGRFTYEPPEGVVWTA